MPATLDLHGYRHHQVDMLVENFILLNQDKVPLTIVCGNSQKMIDLAHTTIERIGCSNVDHTRYGVVVIRTV